MKVLCIVLVLGLLLCATSARAADNEKYWLWGASTTAIVADWGTTLDIENHPGYFEHNQFLGSHPTRAEVNMYFSGILLAHFIGNWAIQLIPNNKLRKYCLRAENYSVMAIHGFGAIYNFQIGLEIAF